MEEAFFRRSPELFSELENNPELSYKLELFETKLEEAVLITEEKDPDEMQPDEQIEAGKKFKELSSVINEIVESMEPGQD